LTIFRSTPFYYVECVTCGAQFVNIFCAKSSHTSCPMDNGDYWSCSFLSKILDITPSLFSFKVCRLCGIHIHCEADNPESGKILDHLITKHNIRGCNQRLFFRQEEFQSHLVTEHSACFGESFVPWLVQTDLVSDSYRREFQSLPQRTSPLSWEHNGNFVAESNAINNLA